MGSRRKLGELAYQLLKGEANEKGGANRDGDKVHRWNY
jgi:hypothetical protein